MPPKSKPKRKAKKPKPRTRPKKAVELEECLEATMDQDMKDILSPGHNVDDPNFREEMIDEEAIGEMHMPQPPIYLAQW